jgi:hypothetical protein
MPGTILDCGRRVALLGIVGLGALLACSDPPSVEPYYLYNGSPVYLRTNATRITIQADSAALPTLAAVAGVTVDSVTSWYAGPSHWIVWLAAGTSTNAALTAARWLRRAPSIQFASNAYDVPGAPAQCPPMMLVNRLIVAFKAGTTASQIATVLERYGLEGSRDRYIDTWWVVHYPLASPYTPLEVSVTVYRDPYVEWADPDRVDCLTNARTRG